MRLYLALLRRNAGAVVAVALLVGVVAGIGLWSLASARRTASAFPRYLDAAEVSDVSVDFFPLEEDGSFTLAGSLDIIARASTIDGVVADATYHAMESMVLAELAGSDARDGPASFPEVIGSLDGRFEDQDRVVLSRGRAPVRSEEGEVLVNATLARSLHLDVGDPLPIDVYDPATFYTEEPGAPIGRIDATVVGIGTFPDEVLADDYDRIARVLLSPAATQRWVELTSYMWHGLRLADADEVGRVVEEYRGLAGDGVVVITRETADQVASVQRSVRPVVVALTAFGIASLAAALAVGALAVARLSRMAGPDRATLRALGMPPHALIAAAAIPGLAAAALVAAVATVAAVVASPLAPLGGARSFEPDRGVDVDPLVIAGGGIVIIGVLALTAYVTARRGGGTVPAPTSPTAAGTAVARLTAGLRPAAGLGVRRGLGASAAGGAPVRTTLAISAVAMATVVAALSFGASIRRLIDEPHRYGWPVDVAMTATGGYDVIDVDGVRRLLEVDDQVTGMTVAGFAPIELGGIDVPSMWAAALRGGLPFTVLSGRLPNSPDEVALGRITADTIGVAVGEEVDGPVGRVRVVGTVALPSIGQLTSSHPSLGEGAIFTAEGLGRFDPSAQPSVLLVDLVEGADADAVAPQLAGRYGPTTSEGGLEPFLLLRPAELADAGDADTTVTALAVVLGLAAIAGLVTVITASVGTRRRELSVLRALGCTSGDLRGSVRWQSATTAVAAGLVGVPLGAIAGSVMWRAFATSLGVDPSSIVPVLTVAGVVVAGVVVTVVASIPAARSAAATSVAAALQPE